MDYIVLMVCVNLGIFNNGDDVTGKGVGNNWKDLWTWIIKEQRLHDKWSYEIWGQDLNRPMNPLDLLFDFQPYGMETTFILCTLLRVYGLNNMKLMIIDCYWLTKPELYIICPPLVQSLLMGSGQRMGRCRRNWSCRKIQNRFVMNTNLCQVFRIYVNSLSVIEHPIRCSLSIESFQVLRISA